MESVGIFDAAEEAERISDGSRNFLQREGQIIMNMADELLLLGDFGLGSTGSHDHDTAGLVGSIGYTAPEYKEWKVVRMTAINGHNTDILSNDDPLSPHDQIHIDMKGDLRNAFRMLDEEWSSTTTKMRDVSLALGALAIGAVVSNALTSASSSSSASVGSAVVLGLCLTLAGIIMRGRKRRGLSVLMTKLGTAATASGILLSLGSHLPPAAACVVGSLAFLVIAVAVALA